ncbi:MAG TPA: hypothetical protein VH251_09665, partial [Verrucomicrobiae bacterium]|nr:hypothetical protein [Verrucomicrobiae bacterium]
MKTRWFWFCICMVGGLVLIGCGLLIPVHLRAVDSGVVLSAGRTGDSLLQRGKQLADTGHLGAAQMFVTAARTAGMSGWDRLGEVVANRAAENPTALFWGNDTYTKNLFSSQPDGDSFSGFIIQREHREEALAHLNNSGSSTVRELLRCRELKQTVLFPPSGSPQGQAFDAVIAECGLLFDGNHITGALNSRIQEVAQQANHGGSSQPLEQLLMDFASLGERLNWDQLTTFVAQIPDDGTLHQLAGQMSIAHDRLPMLFAAVQLSGEPAAVSTYAAKFPQTGLQDISASVWYGANGVKDLADSGQRLYRPDALRWFAAHNPFGSLYYFAAARSLENPWLVLAVKWLFYLGAGFCFAAAVHVYRPPVSPLEELLQVRGFHLLRKLLFSLGFLLVVLLLSEPFLAQEGQTGDFSLRLHLPMAGGAAPAGIGDIKHSIMNPKIILTLLIFFVLQALIYISCLVKLAEIRRQQIPPRMKLKLL